MTPAGYVVQSRLGWPRQNGEKTGTGLEVSKLLPLGKASESIPDRRFAASQPAPHIESPEIDEGFPLGLRNIGGCVIAAAGSSNEYQKGRTMMKSTQFRRIALETSGRVRSRTPRFKKRRYLGTELRRSAGSPGRACSPDCTSRCVHREPGFFRQQFSAVRCLL